MEDWFFNILMFDLIIYYFQHFNCQEDSTAQGIYLWLILGRKEFLNDD